MGFFVETMDQGPMVMEWTLRPVWTEYGGLFVRCSGSFAVVDVIGGRWDIIYVDHI